MHSGGLKASPLVLLRAAASPGVLGHQPTAIYSRPPVPGYCRTHLMTNCAPPGEPGDTISSTSTLMNPCLSCERKPM